ncbi:hypothetical protein [uncultured Ilyobacter sp.]|uniref:hypothetical protein n=1 Tax=uncultured Ilyobacter sp. TaxID=544433 RepID=UPI0029C71480|nr:hypothetical protein [uncultured Ilyobacter sp.]
MKKKGSAIVLAVLLLSFFTAIALAVFYLGGKKGERAYLKVQGEDVSNDIDMGATLAYYDAYMAEQFVRKGKVYAKSHKPSGMDDYPGFSGFDSDKEYPGIKINSYIDFFASNWDYTKGETKLPTIESEFINVKTTPNRLAFRTWNQDEDKIKRMWMQNVNGDADNRLALSIGGYRLEKIVAKQLTNPAGTSEEIYPASPSGTIYDILKSKTSGQIDLDDSWLLETTYVKRIRLNGSSKVGPADFRIKAVHTAVVRFEESNFDNLVVDPGEVIEELIIERM